jgi:plasmid stability protein
VLRRGAARVRPAAAGRAGADAALTGAGIAPGGRPVAIIDGIVDREVFIADLLVWGVDDAVAQALKARAGKNGRSAEAKHRAILASARARPRQRSFAEVLAAMPEVGLDADFKRLNAASEALRAFTLI